MQNSKLHKERSMTEFLARIIGINRVVSQDRGDWTSMTLEQSESIPANKNKTRLASTYYFFNITGDAGFKRLYM